MSNLKLKYLLFGVLVSSISYAKTTTVEKLYIKDVELISTVISSVENGVTIADRNIKGIYNTKKLIKGGYLNSYLVNDAIMRTDIQKLDPFFTYNFGDTNLNNKEIVIESNSLLYDGGYMVDEFKNIDVTMTRNDKTLSDFASSEFTTQAEIFGSLQNETSYSKLNSEQKLVIDGIQTGSVAEINDSLRQLTPTQYANTKKQIIDLGNFYKEESRNAIDNLGENNYSVTLIDRYEDIKEKDEVEGYESQLVGVLGTVKFKNDIYGSIGYSHSDISYQYGESGDIRTVHLGVNKFSKLGDVDLVTGLATEYNIHKNEREIGIVQREASSDFNSYIIRLTNELSTRYDYTEKLYVKPYISLDLGYGSIDSFKESGAGVINVEMGSQDVTTVVPRIGVVGKYEFTDKLSFYSGASISSELGNMDKTLNYNYEGFNGEGQVKGISRDATYEVEAGVNFNINGITLAGAGGFLIEEEENAYLKASIGYTF